MSTGVSFTEEQVRLLGEIRTALKLPDLAAVIRRGIAYVELEADAVKRGDRLSVRLGVFEVSFPLPGDSEKKP